MSQESESTKAAQEAALKYAQKKCLTLVSSASILATDTNTSDHSVSPEGTPMSTPGNLLDSSVSPHAQVQKPKVAKRTPKKASKVDDIDNAGNKSDMEGDDMAFDESTDFGIDQNIARAALTALGSDGMFLSATGDITKSTKSGPTGRKLKKKLSEMDEDEKLLASEEAKKLTSRQRRQLRNRVSARHFRLRRKEYISHLESLVVNMTAKINKLEHSMVECREENQQLKLAMEQVSKKGSISGLPVSQSRSQQSDEMQQKMEVSHQREVNVTLAPNMDAVMSLGPQSQPVNSNFISSLAVQNAQFNKSMQSQARSQQQLPLQQQQQQQQQSRSRSHSRSQQQIQQQQQYPVGRASIGTGIPLLGVPSLDDIPASSPAYMANVGNSSLVDSITPVTCYPQVIPSPASSSPSSSSSWSAQNVFSNNASTVSSTSSAATSIPPSTASADYIRMKPSVVNLLPMYSDNLSNMPMASSQMDMQGLHATGLFNPFDANHFGDAIDWQMDYGDFLQSNNGVNMEMDNGMAAGLIRIPNTQIYHSLLPRLEQQLVSTTKSVAKAESESESTDVKSPVVENKDSTEASIDKTESVVDRPSAKSKGKSPVESGIEEDAKLSMLTAEAIFKRLDLQMSQLQV